MDQTAPTTATIVKRPPRKPRKPRPPRRRRDRSHDGPRGDGRGQPRSRTEPNALRDWLEGTPRPMTKTRFAELIGCTAAYVSILLADDPPWPGREIARLIAIVTEGEVTPNSLAGYPPGD